MCTMYKITLIEVVVKQYSVTHVSVIGFHVRDAVREAGVKFQCLKYDDDTETWCTCTAVPETVLEQERCIVHRVLCFCVLGERSEIKS